MCIQCDVIDEVQAATDKLAEQAERYAAGRDQQLSNTREGRFLLARVAQLKAARAAHAEWWDPMIRPPVTGQVIIDAIKAHGDPITQAALDEIYLQLCFEHSRNAEPTD